MTTTDLINKLAAEHSLTTGRAEMIVSIVVERITEKLKTEGTVKVNEFGDFRAFRNSPSDLIANEQLLSKNRIVFEPGKTFLDTINTA